MRQWRGVRPAYQGPATSSRARVWLTAIVPSCFDGGHPAPKLKRFSKPPAFVCVRLFSLKPAAGEGLLGCFAMRGVAPVLPREQCTRIRRDRLEAHLLEHAEGSADRGRDHWGADLLLDDGDGLQR